MYTRIICTVINILVKFIIVQENLGDGNHKIKIFINIFGLLNNINEILKEKINFENMITAKNFLKLLAGKNILNRLSLQIFMKTTSKETNQP